MKFTFEPSDIKAQESGPNGRYLAAHPDVQQPDLIGVSAVTAQGGLLASVWLPRDVLACWASGVADQYGEPGRNRTMTLNEAGALTAILSAVDRNARVARYVSSRSALVGEARYIGGLADPRDLAAESRADVRDLFLFARLHSGIEQPWKIDDLISEYLASTFIVDFDLAAFEAAGRNT